MDRKKCAYSFFEWITETPVQQQYKGLMVKTGK